MSRRVSFKAIRCDQIRTERIDQALADALSSVEIPEDVDPQRLLGWFVQECLESPWVEEFAAEFVQRIVTDEWCRYRPRYLRAVSLDDGQEEYD